MEKKSVFRKFLYSQKAAPYVFVLPFVLTFLIFFAYPIVDTIVMSFQKVSGGGNEWVGLKNYQTLLNPVFYKALKNSILYMILSCALMIPIPMFLATMLNSKAMKAKGFFRSIMFIPALTSVVVAGVIFRLMFGELEGSFMNQVISFFGMEPMVWLRRTVPVWIALLLLCLWRWTGVNMMYYLSGLQQIPGDLYESADIDGASSIQKFRYITLPLLKPTTVYVLTISIFGGMAMFTESYLLFNGNNSPNNVGLTVVGYLYRMGLTQNNIGLGSAIGVVLLIIVLILNVIQLILNGTFSKKGD
ncbi:carbohydrate ABC transporter permease [Lachnoclostridium sp. An118]|uniref:carbohydrate ABC transporter permease n=1 Tax=Lachnoclostridium sp. An118 TaxID=1965547 RepID=UPI000B3960ED|nr:sugar ABC transporter permease [Lachnoclostridium sp. An118]OUQ47965.1 arabinose transporter permease [Lachnoclostridium sp. An118]